jgi:N-acyl-D-aspartate/D-glutamate deacylase
MLIKGAAPWSMARVRRTFDMRDGLVVAIGDIDESSHRTVDATDRVVAPSFIDPHTHCVLRHLSSMS